MAVVCVQVLQKGSRSRCILGLIISEVGGVGSPEGDQAAPTSGRFAERPPAFAFMLLP